MAQNSTPRKYAFDTEFAADGAVVRESANGAKRLSPEEIAAERAAAYEGGKKDAVAQAEREAAAALRDIAAAASAILTRLDAESRALREEAARVALIAARKIADASLEAFGPERAAAAVEAAMDKLRHQPRLVVKLSPQTAEALKPRLEEMRETHAYAGAVLVRVEPNMSNGAVSIDWTDGVLSTDPQEIAERVEAAVAAALAAPTSPSGA